MDDQNILELYDRFAQIMRENDMGWAVDQVEEQLNQLPDRELADSDLPLDRYTVREQLLLLLRAAEFVMVDTAFMEAEVLDFFSNQTIKTGQSLVQGTLDLTDESDDEDEQAVLSLKGNIFSDDMYEELIETEQDKLRSDVVPLQDMFNKIQERLQVAENFQLLVERIRNEVLNV